MKLSELEKGQRAIVDSVNLKKDLKKRFSSMGLSRGIILRVCRKTFGNDSLHVKLDCSSCIALSKTEANDIDVTPIGGGFGFCNRRGQRKEECCEYIARQEEKQI